MLARMCNLCGERHWGLCPKFATEPEAEHAKKAKAVTELRNLVTPPSLDSTAVGRGRRGRQPTGDRALTPAEKQAAYRARKAAALSMR